MKTNAIFLLFTVALIAGCASNNGPIAPPATAATESATQLKYAEWSDEQLELKRAQLKEKISDYRPAPPSDDTDLGLSMVELGGSVRHRENQKAFDEITVELLRRDPSGALLAKSNTML